jgi:hypothetical protein
MNIRPKRAELFHADGWMERRTVMRKLMVAFRNFANAPKNLWLCRLCDNSYLLLRNILYTASINPHEQYGRHKPASQ